MSAEGDERFVFAAAAHLLAIGGKLGALSGALTILAFAAVLAPLLRPVPVLPWCLALLAGALGVVQLYFGARVAFDSALFRQLAAGTGDLATLDAALQRLGIMPATKAGRPLAPRIAGARGLLLRQAVALAAQAAALSAAGATCL